MPENPDSKPTWQQQAHRDILQRALPREAHLFELTTDGSGWDKHKQAIGSAWILRSKVADLGINKDLLHMKGCSGSTVGTVQRAELLALLHGLHALAQKMDLLSLAGLRKFSGGPVPQLEQYPADHKIPVWWVTDRETIALQVGRKADGTPYYERNTDMDLWCQFYWYENIFQITPSWLDRNTTEDQTSCDEQAGCVRQMFQALLPSLPNAKS